MSQEEYTPQRVVQRRRLRTLRRKRHLGNQKRRRGRGEAATEAEEEAGRVVRL